MIERSIHFNNFGLLLDPSYPRRIDRALLMALSQSFWDDAETASYIGYAAGGLGDIGKKDFVYAVALNDAQVPNVSSSLAARIAGIPVIEGSVVEPWGVPKVASPHAGSAFIAFDAGDPAPPPGNLSPQEDHGGHWAIPVSPEVFGMLRHFFTTGEVAVPCEGPCVLAE